MEGRKYPDLHRGRGDQKVVKREKKKKPQIRNEKRDLGKKQAPST